MGFPWFEGEEVDTMGCSRFPGSEAFLEERKLTSILKVNPRMECKDIRGACSSAILGSFCSEGAAPEVERKG